MLAVGLGAAVLLHGPAAYAEPVTYAAAISGVDDPALMQLLTSVSDTLAPDAEPPASVLHLRRRAERDQARFLEVFQSQAYYGATVDINLDREAAPLKVTFEAVPGPQYRFGDTSISATESEGLPEGVMPEARDLGLQAGEVALAETIAGADGKLLRRLREHGYPSPRVVKRDVVVHPDSETVTVAYTVDAGTRARYGQLQLSGLDKVKPVVAERLVPWEADAWYDEREVTTYRRRLYETGLFSTATVNPGTTADGAVPLLADVTERHHRTVGLGLEYKTDTGPGAQVEWQHRNIAGMGHRLSVNASLGTELRKLELRYGVDHFRRYDQNLVATFEVAQEERDAYDSDRVNALAMIERKVTDRLTVGAGAGLLLSEVEQRREKDSHFLAYLRLEAALDHSNDLLNPTSGFRVNARIEPYAGTSKFVKAHVEATHYLGFGDWEAKDGSVLDNWVLATRLKLGLLAGESRDGVPADIRFYGGGGGSIRGYPFQTVSPLADNDPLGGRSLAEMSIEIRKRVTDSIGLVAFIDGGSAFESSYPDFSEPLKFGAGVGLRYFTPLGPLRFDLAVPLDKRDGLDDSYQIYLSIGQAF